MWVNTELMNFRWKDYWKCLTSGSVTENDDFFFAKFDVKNKRTESRRPRRSKPSRQMRRNFEKGRNG